MGDSQYPHPMSLHWGEGPQKLKKLKNKLLLYFQKRSESNGGDCEIRDTDCSRGYVLIYFKEEEVRDRVLRKERHVLKLPNSEELHLRITLPNAGGPDTAGDTPKSATASQAGPAEDGSAQDKTTPDNEVTQEPPSPLVLIEKVQDRHTSEMLNLLVGNTSHKSEGVDFYLERVPEIQSAVVTFTCDIDIPRFIRTFSSNLRVTHVKLTARSLEEPQSVRVENLPENTSEMHLTAFFENPKQGGGTVQEIVMLPEERAALITFLDTEDVKRVLKKEHVFSKRNISVYPYYPMLSIALYGQQGPCIEIPKPIEFNISPYILQHICNNEDLKNNIDKKMTDKHCEIKWPAQGCQNPALQLIFPPSLATHLRSVAKLVPKWNEEVWNEFSLLISKFRVKEYKMDQSVWEAIREHVNSPTYNRVLIKPEFDSEKVFLAGMSKDVTDVDPTFRKLVEETTEKVERTKQTRTETLSMSPALYQIMCNSGLQKKILDQVPELKIDYDVPTKKARLSGLKEEVLTAKCEILSIKEQLQYKSIQMNPHLVQFLRSTDNEDLSCLLFVRHKVYALLEIDDDHVKLTAYSKKDLMEAEKQMNEQLLHRELSVEDKSLLKTPDWRSLQSHLLQLFNADSFTVQVLESSSGTESNVVIISGLSSSVLICYEQVSDFLEKNTTIQAEIPVQGSAIMKFIWEERKEILEKIKKNVNVTKNENSICVSGPRVKVREAENDIRDIVDSLHCDVLRIEKPGAKKFWNANKELHITAARTNFHCVIVLEEAGVEENLFSKSHFEMNLSKGLTLSVYKEDLCRHNVDVIVNAANEDLKHIGGLAKAILDAAGHKLKDDCDQIIRKDGKLSTGDSVITDAGKLPCKQVIHTVGPRWDPGSPTRCERLLRRAITTSLQLASEKGHSSIAIPAVSSGVFGFPLKLCVENILEAILDYTETPGLQSTLQRIHLVDTNDETVNLFSQVTKAKLGNQTSPVPSTAMAPQPSARGAESPKGRVSKGNTVSTKGGLKIELLQKNIEDCSTDVIVNSVGSNLDLNAGAVSTALLNRAGSGMQQLLDDESLGAQGAAGSVFSTGGCNLNCQEVLHVVTPQWDSGQGTSETILRTIIRQCLTLAEQNGRTSISFPALGTGNLGFPKPFVAFVMFDEISQFCSKNKVQNLQEVHLVLHPSDASTIKAFTSQLANCTEASTSGVTNRQSTGTGSTFFGTVTNPSLGVHEMKIGPATYEVKTGDITKEETDVIVNSSNENFTLNSGVSKAILEAAGLAVASSAAALGSLHHKGYVFTRSGALRQCKWIVHVTGPKQPACIKKIVLDVLQACEKQKVSSVTFPALGTGAGGLAASTVADQILDGLVEFIKSKSVGSLQTVKVVLFQQHMLNDFYMSMKKREGTALPEAKSFITRVTEFFMPRKPLKRVQKLTAFQLVDGIEPVMFSLCAEDKRNVEKTQAWLQQQIEYEQSEKVIREECISELEEAEVKKFCDLQKKFQVSVIYKPPDPSIQILGLTRDVMAVSGEIEMIINRVKDRKKKERTAELTGNLVEWKYETRGNMFPFDKMTNLELEEAKTDKKDKITIQIQGQQYAVSIKTEKATDTQGNQIRIQRFVKHGGESVTLPTHWKTMGKTLVMEVDVAPGTSEYTTVQQKFQKSCGNRILKILRVQNRDLWLNYQIKKQNIDSKNGSTNNEKELFHGTNADSIQYVNHYGFNRSYAGKNGAAFGNGTYFAVNASYSASSTYAKPDASGQKHMYLARALTGQYCQGRGGMITPPAKSTANVTDLYDSLTDNIQHPSMFVIFNDIQAYPEYHIIFQ